MPGASQSAPTRATDVPLTITCPEWCQVAPLDHRDKLDDHDGRCIHWSARIFVDDAEGYSDADTPEPRRWPPVDVALSTETFPSGQQSASSVVTVCDMEVSVSQAAGLAEALLTVVAHEGPDAVDMRGILRAMVSLCGLDGVAEFLRLEAEDMRAAIGDLTLRTESEAPAGKAPTVKSVRTAIDRGELAAFAADGVTRAYVRADDVDAWLSRTQSADSPQDL